MGRVYGYATHVPALGMGMMMTDGDVLELGTGLVSTPMLSAMIKFTNRRLVSLEQSERWWRGMSQQYQGERHDVVYCPGFERMEEIATSQRWGLVLVDHELPDQVSYEHRVKMLGMLRSWAEVVVVHDTEDDRVDWDGAMDDYRFRWTFRMVTPWTTMLSNSVDIVDVVKKMVGFESLT
jgi:hypothetical protein